MSKELEDRLALVPERWRDTARTRAYAMMDYLAAGDDASLLVDVLCRRTGVTRSSFYYMVRKWKASGGDAAAIVPWARLPDSAPRIPPAATAHVDAVVRVLLDADLHQPAEPMVRELLANWPEGVHKPGLSYLRRRIAQLRDEREKKTASVKGDADDFVPRNLMPRWPLDVIVVDHVALEVAVRRRDGGSTLPIATLAIDGYTREPVAVGLSTDAPSPERTLEVLADLAWFATAVNAPAPPICSLAVATRDGWRDLAAAMRDVGVRVAERRSYALRFGGEAKDMLGPHLAGYRLAPRLGHRPPDRRITDGMLGEVPARDFGKLVSSLQDYVAARRATIVPAGDVWGDGSSERHVWESLVKMPYAGLRRE